MRIKDLERVWKTSVLIRCGTAKCSLDCSFGPTAFLRRSRLRTFSSPTIGLGSPRRKGIREKKENAVANVGR